MEDLQKVHYDKPERALSTCIVMSTPVLVMNYHQMIILQMRAGKIHLTSR